MVAISCATFIIGPLSPPSAAAAPPHCRRGRAAAEQPLAGDPRRDAADIGADPRIARGAGGEPVFFAVGQSVIPNRNQSTFSGAQLKNTIAAC